MTKHSPIKKALLASGVLLASGGAAMAQEYHNTTERIGGTWASGMPTVTIAASADITVDGDWYLTANTITIDPAAKISGAGTIHLMTPATYGAAAAATTLNAGGNMGSGTGIGCKLSIENSNTITLAGSNDLVLSSNLNFGSPGAHVVLNTRNVVFTSTGTVTYTDLNTAGFTPDPNPGTPNQAYFVTNGANSGVVTKQGVANTMAFTFPVGQSGPAAAPYDYTPATVTNTSGTARTYSTSVQSYANSTPIEGNVAYGINRTWQVTADVAGTATLSLQHNDVTNANNIGTDGTSFNPAAAYITQYGSAWSTSNATTNGGTPVNTIASSLTIPASGNSSYFSKTSDVLNSLNPFIGVSPVVFLQGAWNGTGHTTALNTAGVIPTTQPYNVAPFNYAGTESVTSIPANVTDWVLVELRNSAAPATVVATRAAFVMNNGNVVDLDGSSPIYFRNYAPGNYFVAVRHRNHLGVRSATAQNFVQDVATPYNFTTAQSQAYQDGTITTNAAMVDLSGNGTAFGLWGGNANSNTNVRFSGPGNDPNYILNTSLGGNNLLIQNPVYDPGDVNMNGLVRYSGPGNDPAFILNTVLVGNNLLIINQHL